jgi:hypothetical protein
MRGTRALAILAIAATLFDPAFAQAPANPAARQDDTIRVAADLAADIAELNALLQQLALPIISPKPVQARAQPNQAAPSIFTVPAGEPVELLGQENGWVLGRTPDDRAGWLPAIAFPSVPNVESIMETLIEKAQEIQQKYENGPIQISGFSLDLFPPGMRVNFNFR